MAGSRPGRHGRERLNRETRREQHRLGFARHLAGFDRFEPAQNAQATVDVGYRIAEPQAELVGDEGVLPGRASRRRAPTPIRSAAARRTRSPAASRSITKRRQIRTGIRCFGKPRRPRFSWFAAERHRQVADIVGCTLAQRIVVTDLADPAINMLDAIRRAGSGREDVDDLAAQCRFAWPVDPLFEGVADPQQMCFQLVSRDGPARSKGNPTAAAPALREPAQVRAGHQRDAQRGARCAPHVSPRAGPARRAHSSSRTATNPRAPPPRRTGRDPQGLKSSHPA